MNAQFHTPSFGDEVIFDLPDNETDYETISKDQGGTGIYTAPSSVIHHQHQEEVLGHQKLSEVCVNIICVKLEVFYKIK